MNDIVYLIGELTEPNPIQAEIDVPTLIKGDKGNDGDSAYQVAVNNGFVGTQEQWLASLQGNAGADGNYIWKTSTAPSTPNYTFTISNLSGPTGKSPKVGDAVFYSTYYYILTEVGTTTVKAAARTSIKGSNGSNYTITEADYNAIATVVIGMLDVAEEETY